MVVIESRAYIIFFSDWSVSGESKLGMGWVESKLEGFLKF